MENNKLYSEEQLDKIHSEIKKVVLEAGEILIKERPKILEGVGIDEKPDKSKVTYVDYLIQKLFDDKFPEIVKKILGPKIKVALIGEESKNKSEKIEEAKKADFLFIIDPLDGTWGYTIKDNFEYGTGVGLFSRSQMSSEILFNPISGFFYLPELELITGDSSSLFETCETYSLSLLNNTAIKASNSLDLSDKKATLQKSSRGDLSYLEKLKDIFGDPQVLFAGSMAGLVDRLKPTAAGLGRIAQVAASGNLPQKCNYLHTQRKPAIWDVYSGSAYIVENAGGSVIHPNGKSVFPLNLTSQTTNLEGKLAIDPKIDSIIAIPKIAVNKILEIINSK